MDRRWAVRAQRVVLGAGILTLASAGVAGASEGPRITVTPNTHLDDGDVVRVDGKGWPDPAGEDQTWFLAQCSVTGIDTSRCGRLQEIPESEISDTGSYSVPYTVARSFESYTGDNTVVCGQQADDCYVVAVYFVNPYRPVGSTASAAISFEPTSK